VTQLHKKLQLQQDRADDLQRQYMETKGMLESESSRTTDLEKILASKAVDGDRDRAALARAEEELSRTRREAEKAEKALAKLKAATNSAAASGTTVVDPELQEERDKLYVSPVLRQLFRSGLGF
jgi:septal ring factor EnvC (AmiA/AmiB activator)